MKNIFYIFLFFAFFQCTPTTKVSQNGDWKRFENGLTPFETKENYSATYFEAIAFYQYLAKTYPQKIKFEAVGTTDSGQPLHTAVIASNGDFTPEKARLSNKRIIFINNGIHAGEPCGVDASMMLARDYLTRPTLQKHLERVVLVIVPLYNIGGALNRNSTTRVNQNGPSAYGFRGNAQNLDLNRDFIKCDSKNAETFNRIFNQWLPDIFIDTHTSNGADYQHTMTLIPTQHNKLEAHLADFLTQKMLPDLYRRMETAGWAMTPYVNARSTPDEGIAGFLDLPRYSSGYAALFNAISFMPETHMLKPFKDRVLSTYAFLNAVVEFVFVEQEALKIARSKADASVRTMSTFAIHWKLNMDKKDKIRFKGYEAGYKKSEVTGFDRLYYDRNAPYERDIPFWNTYETSLSIAKPLAYIVPQSVHRVIERLKWNGVEMRQLAKDTVLEVEVYVISDYKTTQQPYEGHYLHSNIKVEKNKTLLSFKAGDYVIFTDQIRNRYIVETLEPQAPDSYFAWNFFDPILQRKEYFSDYVFEELAADLLEKHPVLKADFEEKKAKDADFAASADAQLDFIYRHSRHAEPSFNRYPVGRLVQPIALPLR